MKLTDKELIELYYKRNTISDMGIIRFLCEILLFILILKLSIVAFIIGIIMVVTAIIHRKAGKLDKTIEEEMKKRGLLK